MGDQYEVAERVFAKMKGYPAWPAKVVERVAGKEEKYRINFYGTHDDSIVKLDQLYRYNAETKAKYGKPQRKAQFKQAMEEIEADVVETEEPDSPAAVKEEENVADSEGELMIDENTLSLPPVLTREATKSETPDNSKSKRPRTLMKRDSVSSATGAPPVTPTIATPDANQPPTTEIVSRSGRKIKPKRFADDEITLPIIPVNKAGGKVVGSEESGPPAKRAKRGTKSIGSKNAATPTPAPVEDKSEKDIPTPTKAKPGTPKAKAIAVTPVVKQTAGRLSPDISAPIVTRALPSLKPAPVRRSASGGKKLPALIPTASLPKIANTRRSERQTRSKSMEDEENQNDVPLLTLKESEDVDNKENSTTKPPDDNDVEENESNELPMPSKRRPVPPAHKLPASVEKKVRVAGKNGLQFELSYVQNSDSKNEEQTRMFQVVAKENVDKLKEDLSRSDIESQEIINSTAEVVDNIDIDEAKSREARTVQIRLLRLEGEVIEIIGEIVGCLNVGSADCDRAAELLERLESHQLNPLMLKKHPEVVTTVKRLRSYVGNVDAWGFTTEQKVEFEVKALGIRQRAVEVYKHFQDLFCTGSDDVFAKVFQEEVEKFKESIKELPMKSILGLTEDESGELLEFDYEINENGDNEEATEEV